jgi:DNA polymerase III subunit alpha
MRKLKLPETYAPTRRIRVPKPTNSSVPYSDFWHLHAHSRFSVKDALPSPAELARTAWTHHQPALALTDHGNMAGAVQLYQACKKHNLAPFPGTELYLRQDRYVHDSKRFHIGLVAFTTEGYEALVRINSRSYSRERGAFHHKPHIDFSDMAEWAELGWTEHLALTTGCFFGMVAQTLVNAGRAEASFLVQTLANWFPHTYVELQHHHISDETHNDDDLVDELYMLAHDLGLPVVVTQDAHYCHPEDKPAHETLKRLVSWSEDPSEAVFPGDSFHLADEDFVREHYGYLAWEAGLAGLKDLLAKHTLIIPELERYHYNVPIVTAGDPYDELREACTEALLIKSIGGVNRVSLRRYEDRLAEELDVVRATDMAGYLMLNKKVCDWMRHEGIFFQARGSASGSLICFLLDITQEDPLLGGLRYERFLSKDRTKPPDIDLDVEDERRHDVLDWLAQHFNVCQIGTWAEYSADRVSGRGSLLVDYLSRRRKEGATSQELAHIESLNDIPPRDRRELFALAEKRSFKSYGTHAGGVVVTANRREFDGLVPTMLVASSSTTVTQYEMDDVEALGLLKLDVLGQRSLSLLSRCVQMLGHDPNDMSWVPVDDKETFRAIRRQDVDGVFQLEGWTNRKGCKELKPRSLRDIIHLVALYRPATIDNGMKDLYIKRRAGWETPPDRHPVLMKALKETYGVPVFQDQIIEVLRAIGFTPEDLTALLKAVKASNENIGNAAQVIRGFKQTFRELASQAGFGAADIVFTWEAIEGFAKYGFNKAHATAYGRRSYWMTYLKVHHPLEFHTALLQVNAGTPKERDYVLATKAAGIPMLKPDVNVSSATWTIDHRVNGIRKGLVSIKGIGEKAATELAANAPFADVADLIARCDARAVNGGKNYHRDGTLNGVLKKLEDAGALRSLT